MRSIGLCLLLLMVFSTSTRAQDKTYASAGFFLQQTDEQAVVLPCRPDMLISDIDLEIMNRDGMNPKEARELLRMELSHIVAEQCRVFARGDVMLPERENLQAYQQLFRNATYTERPMPVRDKSDLRAAKIKQILQATEEEEGTWLEQGQIKTVLGKKETYMDLNLDADSAVKAMWNKTEFDYLICLNELDIRVLRDPAQDVGQTFDRKVKVHYSIFDPEGRSVTSGAAATIYPGTEKGIRPLLDRYLPLVAAQIAAEIARVESEETEESVPENAAPSPEKKNKSTLKSLLKGDDDDF